jgi:hypothetical protein
MKDRAGTPSQRKCTRPRRAALAGRTIVLVLLVSGRPAVAQTVIVLDGALNLEYSVTTPSEEGAGGFVTQISPSVTLQTGSARLVWRINYAFAGTLNLYGAGSSAYSNQLGLGLAAALSDRTMMTVSGNVSYGGTLLLSQRPADTGQPGFRAPGNPNQLTVSLGEALAWEASPHLRLTQALQGSAVALEPLDQFNVQLAGLLRLDHTFATDAIGVGFAPTVARLRPLTATGDPYLAVMNILSGTWTHDFDWRWGQQLTAGISQVVAYTGSVPLSIVPVGGLTVQYRARNGGAGLALAYGPTIDLPTGTVTQSGSVGARGFLNFDALRPRQLAASVGFLRSRPLGAVAAGLAPGIGDALQGDIGFMWGMTDAILGTMRCSVHYQFGQPSGLAPSLAFTFIVGLTGRYSNASTMPSMPTIGRRVDGSDAVGFTNSDAGKP